MRILLLTDSGNGDEAEDLLTAQFLRRAFEVDIQALAHAREDRADIVLVRNTWPATPDPGYRPLKRAVRERIEKRDIPLYNPLSCKGDMQGKSYLAQLWTQGYPVIPSSQDPCELPRSKEYLAKPLDGWSGHGIRTLSREELLASPPPDTILQPRISFLEEVSFAFVDNEYCYALRTLGERWRLEPFEPSAPDLAFARRFVEWSAMPYGICRIDACRTHDGLLLMEIEDDSPYLSLPEIPSCLQELFLAKLEASLARAASRKGPRGTRD